MDKNELSCSEVLHRKSRVEDHINNRFLMIDTKLLRQLDRCRVPHDTGLFKFTHSGRGYWVCERTSSFGGLL